MTHVLLISDTDRVQRLFEPLAGKGDVQLHTAPTLVRADEEIAAAPPDYVFLQSRISGFSGEIASRHLQKSLPKKAKLVLLAVDEEDAAQARKHAMPFLSLGLDDEELVDAVAAVVQGKRVAKKAPRPAVPKGKEQPVPPVVAEAAEPVEPGLRAGELPPAAQEPEGAASAEPTPPTAPASEPAAPAAQKGRAAKAQAVAWLPPSITEPEPEPVPSELPPPPSAQVEEVVELSSAHRTPRSQELPREPEHEEAQEQAEAEPPHQVEPPRQSPAGRSFDEFFDQAATPSARKPLEIEDFASFTLPGAEGDASTQSVRRLAARLHAEGLAAQHHHKKNHKRWVIPVALCLVFIPLLYFFVLSEPLKRFGFPAGAPAAKSTTSQARPSASVPAPTTSRPQVVAQLPPRNQPAPPAAAHPPAAPAKTGLKVIPPFLAGATPDPAYAQSHPGWQRYVGARAEYRLFKEGDLYRAIQVLAQRRQAIPEELFRRVLLEFGGADSYLLESREKKGPYVIERGETKGNLALTIYRNNKDLAVKGLVLYYR